MADAIGWHDIARAVGKALGQSVSERTARRYADPTWPTVDDPHPLPVGQRGNGVRWLAAEDLRTWAAWFKGQPGQKSRLRPAGDRRHHRRATPIRTVTPPA